jgi:hypothetical protein
MANRHQRRTVKDCTQILWSKAGDELSWEIRTIMVANIRIIMVSRHHVEL